MGDKEPGSSTAAQSVPEDPISSHLEKTQQVQTQPNGSFMTRLAHVFFPNSSPEQINVPPVPAPNALSHAIDLPGMLNLRRLRVDDVMVPKADVVSVPVDIKKDALVQVFRESGNTRLPVFEGTLDTPIGLVHLKDFALGHGFNSNGGRFSLKKMIRPLLFAPPSMPIGVLLQKMQTERMHMALVIDEYGGVDGLVTLEDCVEQVLGEIEDEHDIDDDVFWTSTSAGVYIALAKAPLDELETETGLRLTPEEDDEEIDTLGGLIFLLTGRVPVRGEVIAHSSGTEFEIIDADPRRIKRVRVRLPQAAKAARAARAIIANSDAAETPAKDA